MFALIGNTLLYYIVFFFGIVANLVANCYIMPIANYIFVMLYSIPIRVVFKALGDLVVPIKDFIVIELTNK